MVGVAASCSVGFAFASRRCAHLQMEASKEKIAQELKILEGSHALVCDEIERNFDKILEAVKERKATLISDASQLRASKVRLGDHSGRAALEGLVAAFSLLTHQWCGRCRRRP